MSARGHLDPQQTGFGKPNILLKELNLFLTVNLYESYSYMKYKHRVRGKKKMDDDKMFITGKMSLKKDRFHVLYKELKIETDSEWSQTAKNKAPAKSKDEDLLSAFKYM